MSPSVIWKLPNFIFTLFFVSINSRFGCYFLPARNEHGTRSLTTFFPNFLESIGLSLMPTHDANLSNFFLLFCCEIFHPLQIGLIDTLFLFVYRHRFPLLRTRKEPTCRHT